MRINLTSLLLLFFLLGADMPDQDRPLPKELIQQMFEQTSRIHTLSYTMHKFERMAGEMTEQIADIKYKRQPFKVYARQRFPNDGLEVLYVQGENKNRALVNPNGFPWINVSLDPHSYQMRKDQHHTVLDTGYDLVINILEHLVDKYRSQTDDILKLLDYTEIDGEKCWILELDNPNFRYHSYTVKEGESLISIAEKFKLSEHMILERNKVVDDYTTLTAGQVIELPNDYCRKMILTMEQDRMIPRVMKIYDDQGLYELYEFKKVVINPRFAETEFTRDFEGYGF